MDNFAWMETISTFGFPAVVCLYVLVRIDSSLGNLARAIERIEARFDIWVDMQKNLHNNT